MKKVIAIIGSPNHEKSNTVTMTKDYLEMVKGFYSEVEYEVISLGDELIKPCHGCWACMKVGECVHKDDGLQEIAQKMLDSDLLIIGSPVYVQQISAQTKALIDRLFIWIHLSRLIGKPTLTAITTAAEGMKLTEWYLVGVMTMLGCIMVGHLRGYGLQPGFFVGRERCRKKYKSLAKNVADILRGDRRLKPGLLNTFCFWMMKHHNNRSYEKEGPDYYVFERQYWADKGWTHISYKEAFKKERARAGSEAF